MCSASVACFRMGASPLLGRKHRMAVISHLLWPSFWHKYSLPQSIWWDALEKGMLAFEDLGCVELLG
jgi:hypothetical protein